MIEKGADVKAKTIDCVTPLHIASANGNRDLVALLLKHGADINAKSNNGDTALTKSAKDNKEIALFLVDHGANVSYASFPNGHTALHWAAAHNNPKLATRLLQDGADVNVANRNGRTPLHTAAEQNSKEVIDLLIEHGANVNALNVANESPLILALRNNHKDASLQLLQLGADAKGRSKDGNSTLHWAAKYKYEELTSLLLLQNTEVNAVNHDGMTALHFAAMKNNLSGVKLLLQHGANVNSKDTRRNNPLHFALERNNVNVCFVLLADGADVDTANENGNNPLHLATNTNDEELAFILAKKAKQLNALNMQGDTALHRAVKRNNRIVTSALLDCGADVNALNTDGNTPLHCACMQRTGEATTQLLISKAAVVDCRNKLGLTALHFAVTDGSLNIVKLLVENGAKVNITDDSGNSPLYFSLIHEKFQICNHLLTVPNIQVNSPDVRGHSPFHLLAQTAVERGRYENKKAEITSVAQNLLKNGATVNIRNLKDQTPLHLSKNLATAEVLLESGAWPNVRENYGGNTPLLLNAKVSSAEDSYFLEGEELQKIVDKGMNPWIANDDGKTVLGILLAESSDFKVVRNLIRVMKGKDDQNISKKHSNGDSLLHQICVCGKDEILELLEMLSLVDANSVNTFMETPLHLVCRKIRELPQGASSVPVFYWSVRHLITHRANPRLKDVKGETCLDIARDVPQLFSLLEEPVDVANVPQLLKWSEPKSYKHKVKVAEVVRGRNSFKIESYHCYNEPIGTGAFSHVYAAVDEKDGHEVAVKCMVRSKMRRPEDQREISTLVKLCHCEDVVRYYGCISQGHFVYIILELMEGTLEDLLKDPTENIYQANLSTTLCQDVVRGLRFFHARDVLHRDIKPANILYKKSPRLCLKIADFGLSSNAAGETQSVMHTNAGTRCWMAPELLQGPDKTGHSFASDVFSCGLVLHYILTDKKHPFAPATENTKRSAIEMQNETERNIMMHNSNISDKILAEARHLIGIMLSKEKENRPIAGAIIGHPLFWSNKKKSQFLSAVGNQPEIQEPRHIVREHSSVEKELENALDSTFADEPWDFAVYPTYAEMTYTGRGRRYITSSSIDLIRFIRNSLAHVSDPSRSTQFQQDILENFVFLKEFPSLLIEVYKAVMLSGWDTDRPEIKSVLFDE